MIHMPPARNRLYESEWSGERQSIPPITDPMGKMWEQPDPSRIIIHGHFALMDENAFDLLHEYSSSVPTLVYVGKMWKARVGMDWVLRFWDFSHKGEYFCKMQERLIVVHK